MAREGSVLKTPDDDPDEGLADERLLIEAAQRDPKRFAKLYEDNFDRVYVYIARRIRDRVDAQDLTSQVFHRALANIGRFEWRGAPFASWLFRIAANAIADHTERRSREQNLPRVEEPQQTTDQESRLDEIERRARLFRYVSTLPDDQRRVIHMRFAEEKSIREIAIDLGRTEGAVKQLQFRALENLRARMGGENG
jgi:RNA polymerase sigma-70 factor (ECF subfamily)